MDQDRFEAALQALNDATTRRRGLTAALGAILGGALASTATPDSEAKSRKHRKRRKKCTRSNCRNGCCDGKRCKSGTKDTACGNQGAACAVCTDGAICRDHTCKRPGGDCTAATCPNGCCEGGFCKPGTANSACGTGGAACVVCPSSAPLCTNAVCAAGAWENQTTFGVSNIVEDTTFWYPTNTVVSADNLTAWVADTNNNRVVIWSRPDASSSAWTYRAQFGTEGSGDSNFDDPQGVFVSVDTRTAWVADRLNNRVVIWTRPDGSSTTWTYSTQFGTYGSGDSNFRNPVGVFVSTDTLTAWVVDAGNNRIAVWTRPDASSTTWTSSARFGSPGSGDSNLSLPRGVFVSADTLTAWVADTLNDRVVIWTRPDGSSTTWSYSTQFGTRGSGNNNFSSPASVVVSTDRLTAWVADTNNNRIAVWTRPDPSSTTWSYSAQIGAFGSGNTNLAYPAGLAVSADGLTIWITDTGNSRMVIWTRPDASSTAWTYSTQFGTSGASPESFWSPLGVFVSTDRLTAWVADQFNNRVTIWTRPSPSSPTWSPNAQFGTQGNGPDNLFSPAGASVSADNLTAWVVDAGNNRIAIWTRPDASSTTWSSTARFGTSGAGNENFSLPQAIFVSADTLTAWVADTLNNRIVVWTRPKATSRQWSYSAQFGTSGSGDTNLFYPSGIFVSADGLTAWVADTLNNRIVVWTRPNSSSTAWSYTTQFGTSGSGDTNFDSPFGIVVSPDTLTAWVADSGNNRIAIWTRRTATSTVWRYSAQFGTAGSGAGNLASPSGIAVAADARTVWTADSVDNRISVWTQR